MKKNSRKKLHKRSSTKKWLLISITMLFTITLFVAMYLTKSSEVLPAISSKEYSHGKFFSKSLVVDGIDVSAIQGRDVDWKTLKRSGVDFVFLRAGYTDFKSGKHEKDIMFDKHAKDARAAGIMVGAYMFSQATSVKEAKKEAKFLVDAASEHDIQLPLVMDYELANDGKLQKALNDGKLDGKTSKIVSAFCSTVEEAGYDSMLYGNFHFLTKTLDIKSNSKRTNIWLAHYADKTDFEHKYSFWQASDGAKVNGIPKNVDRDFWYIQPSKVIKSHVPDNSRRKSLGKAKIVFTREDKTYRHRNSPVEPEVYVKLGIKRLRQGKDYDVSYIKNCRAGTGYVIVTGKGKYKDTIVNDFEIKNWF